MYFAGIMLLLLGGFQIIEGLTALFNRTYLLVSSNGLLVTANLAAWGWLHLIIGVVALVAGYGIIVGKRWAQILGIVLACVSALVNLTYIAAYPLWSITIIAVDILVIHALAVHGREVQRGLSRGRVGTGPTASLGARSPCRGPVHRAVPVGRCRVPRILPGGVPRAPRSAEPASCGSADSPSWRTSISSIPRDRSRASRPRSAAWSAGPVRITVCAGSSLTPASADGLDQGGGHRSRDPDLVGTKRHVASRCGATAPATLR